MTIAHISLGEKNTTKLSNAVKDLISSNKGTVLNSDVWGKRKFAYEIDHESEGYYEVITFEMAPESVAIFKQKLNLLEGLVRYLISTV